MFQWLVTIIYSYVARCFFTLDKNEVIDSILFYLDSLFRLILPCHLTFIVLLISYLRSAICKPSSYCLWYCHMFLLLNAERNHMTTCYFNPFPTCYSNKWHVWIDWTVIKIVAGNGINCQFILEKEDYSQWWDKFPIVGLYLPQELFFTIEGPQQNLFFLSREDMMRFLIRCLRSLVLLPLMSIKTLGLLKDFSSLFWLHDKDNESMLYI